MAEPDKPDILIFLSDQHGFRWWSLGGESVIQTPNMEALAADGMCFDSAYTPSPLCVPARVSFLTSMLPSSTGVFTNDGTIRGDRATFLHALGATGYETVLCGRMHFVGEDQRHGFTKRIMDDFTPQYWGRGGKQRTDLGRFAGTTGAMDCLREVGGGVSPVLDYDEAVIQAALDYLAEDHEKPQCIVVGTYGPH